MNHTSFDHSAFSVDPAYKSSEFASDFVLEAELKSTAREYRHRNLSFVFGWQDLTY